MSLPRAITEPDLAEPPSPSSAAIRDVEERLIGALLRDGAIADRLTGLVGAEHFSSALRERLFDAAIQAARDGSPMASVSEDVGIYEWDEPGGVDAYISKLIDLRPPSMSIEQAGMAIRDSAEQRSGMSVPYHLDVAAWAHRQAALLAELARADRSSSVDWPNIIEEILSVGRSEVSGVARRIELTFVHLVKAVSSPDARSGRTWRSEIGLHIAVVRSDYAPSMRKLLNLERLWTRAVQEAGASLAEYGERIARHLPKACPLTMDELVAKRSPDDLVKLFASRLGEAADGPG